MTNSRLPAEKAVKAYHDAAMLRTASKTGRARFAGTRRVAVASQTIRLGCLWESWPTTTCTCTGNSTHGPRGQTVNGTAHQASDQGRSEGHVSRSEVARPCGVGLPLGPALLRRVRVTTTVGRNVYAVTHGEVRTEKGQNGPLYQRDDRLACVHSRGTPRTRYWGQPTYPAKVARMARLPNNSESYLCGKLGVTFSQKKSLTTLLPKYYDVHNRGTIRVASKDLSDMPLESWPFAEVGALQAHEGGMLGRFLWLPLQ